MSVNPSQCSVFVQIWVDTNAVENGQSQGVYMVDNRVGNGSQNEGSPSLETALSNGSYVCWQVANVNAQSLDTVTLQSIGNSKAWGNDGQPQKYNDTTFTGRVENPGQAPYQLTLNYQLAGGSGGTLPLNNPSMNVLT